MSSVSTLSRAMSMLEVFLTSPEPLGNADIAERTGLPKPTVSRLAKALVSHGMLEYLPKLRAYQLGHAVLALSNAKLAGSDVRQVAYPFMQHLAAEEGVSVDLASPAGTDVIYLEVVRPPGGGNSVIAHVGSRTPIDVTASGRACLAVMAPAARFAVLEQCRRLRGDSWPAIRVRIDAAIDEVVARGFCVVVGDYRSDVTSVGCAIADPRRGVVYSLSCTLIGKAVPPERLQARLGPLLLKLRERVMAGAGM